MPPTNCSRTPPIANFEASVVNAIGALGSGWDNCTAFMTICFDNWNMGSRLFSAQYCLNVTFGGNLVVAALYNGCKISAGDLLSVHGRQRL